MVVRDALGLDGGESTEAHMKREGAGNYTTLPQCIYERWGKM